MNSVLDAWRSLEPVKSSEEGWNAIRIFPEAPFPIRAALEQPTGRLAVLFDFRSSSVTPVRDYPSTRGFECFPENLKPGPNGSVRLCLVFSPGFDMSLSARLGQDVAEAASSTASENDGVRALLARLEAWQIFLRKHAEGLSQEEQSGLFGEISFLRYLLDLGVPPLNAVSAWMGPDGGLRDFVWTGCEVEVKTTLGAATSFRVFNFSQLDESGIPNLLLCHYTLSMAESGDTLPELISDMLGRFPEHERHDFERLMILAGYSEHHVRHYELRRYKVSSMQFYMVRDNFPRIRPVDVRLGVLGGSYAVDLRACEPYRLEPGTFLPLLDVR